MPRATAFGGLHPSRIARAEMRWHDDSHISSAASPAHPERSNRDCVPSNRVHRPGELSSRGSARQGDLCVGQGTDGGRGEPFDACGRTRWIPSLFSDVRQLGRPRNRIGQAVGVAQILGTRCQRRAERRTRYNTGRNLANPLGRCERGRRSGGRTRPGAGIRECLLRQSACMFAALATGARRAFSCARNLRKSSRVPA